MHGRKANNPAVNNMPGLFGKALAATPFYSDYAVVDDDPRLDGLNQLTISMWVYRNNSRELNTSDQGGLFGKRIGFNDQHSYAAYLETDGSIHVDIDSANDRFATVGKLPILKWTHVVITYDGNEANASQRVKVYFDGALDTTASESSTSIPNYSSNLTIGALNADYFLWNGLIDEFALWNKTLSTTEVSDLYHRGAGKVSFQLRTCANSDCSDRVSNAGWVGSDGSQTSTFTEELNTTGNAADIDLTSIASLATWLSTENKRYIQYKFAVETLNTAIVPEVSRVQIGSQLYDTLTPSIESSSTIGIPFASLSNFTEVLGTDGCSGGVTYQLATLTSGWKYWNGTSWASATLSTHSNAANIINANISSFSNDFGPSTAGTNNTLLVKLLLNSNGSTACAVDTISIGGLHYSN